MLSGENYNSRDEELLDLYWRARKGLQSFQQESANPERMQFLREFIPGIHETVWIEPPFSCEYGSHISVGRGTYINVHCFLQDCGKIEIGEDVLIGPGVNVCTASHPLDSHERIQRTAQGSSYLTSAKPVKIGDRVWIGANVTILGGVIIGDDAVIGAGSVVTKDVPAGMLAYGVPCRIRN